MKFSLSLEIVVNPAAPVLPVIGCALAEQGIVPVDLVWSMVADSGEARLWMSFEGTEEQADALAITLGAMPAVLRVHLNQPLAAGLSEKLRSLSPFPKK